MEHGRMIWAGGLEEGLALYLERYPAAMAEAERASRFTAARAVAG